MKVRSVEQWSDILRGMFPQDAAKRIMSDITHYRHGGIYENDDKEQLASALMAFANLQQEN